MLLIKMELTKEQEDFIIELGLEIAKERKRNLINENKKLQAEIDREHVLEVMQETEQAYKDTIKDIENGGLI